MISMYIRCANQKNKKTGTIYSTYRLVESYRNSQGKVRQQVLLNLGNQFQFPKEKWKMLADRVEELLPGQKNLFPLEDVSLEKEAQRIAKLIVHKYSLSQSQRSTEAIQQTMPVDYQTVDVNSLMHQDVRKIGAEAVGYHAAKQLRLAEILKSVGLNKTQINLALGTIIARLVHPGSELKTHRYLTERSALDELLGTNFSSLPLTNLYRISDAILKHKQAIETALYQREKDLFNLSETITLYDLTNTYFEGRCLINPKAQYGRSKEKRSDCCLVSLGMVLDSSGFPKSTRFFPGNISEPKTLKEMLSALGGHKKSLVVMDAGIATEENLTWLKGEGYKYMVVSRRPKLVMPTNKESVIVKEARDNRVTAILVENEATDELELYCHSEAKEAKTKQMQNKACERYEDELKKLAEGLNKKGSIKKYDKVLQRLGRLKEKHKRIGKRFKVTVEADEKNQKAIAITWVQVEVADNEKAPGTYCLRTNEKGLDEKTFWNLYVTLTEVEAAFRCLKSDLRFRPVFHQKEDRVDGHLFICILAYHLLHTIRSQLKTHGINERWETIRELLDTQCRITSTLQLKDNKTVKIRKTTSPDTNQYAIYQALKIGSHPGETEKAYF